MVNVFVLDRVVRVRTWQGTLCCVLGQDFTLTVPLSTQVCKWVPTNKMLGYSSDGLATHPGENRNTPSCFMLQKPG